MSILTGRKKTQFSHLCSSVIPYPIETKFATEMLARCLWLTLRFVNQARAHEGQQWTHARFTEIVFQKVHVCLYVCICFSFHTHVSKVCLRYVIKLLGR